MPFLNWQELSPFFPQSEGRRVIRVGDWWDEEDASRKVSQFAEFQPGDEIWVDRKNVPWKWLPEGWLLLGYAECRCRLARDGKTIASRVLWLT